MAAAFPTSVVTDAVLGLVLNGAQTTLNGGINNSVTTITVTDTTSFPTAGYFVIDSEVIQYTGKTSVTFTGCTRGSDSSAAASHLTAAAVSGFVVAANITNMQLEIKAIEADISARFGIGASSNAIVVPSGVNFQIVGNNSDMNTATGLMYLHSNSASFNRGIRFSGGVTVDPYIYSPIASDDIRFGNTTGVVKVDTFSITSAGVATFLTGDCRARRANIGGDVLLQAFNSDNTNGASNAGLQIISGGNSGGDPYVFFQVNGNTGVIMGVDNSDSKAFVIACSAALGTTNALRIDASTQEAKFSSNFFATTTTGGTTIRSVGTKDYTCSTVQNSKTLQFDTSAIVMFWIYGSSGDGCLVVSTYSTATITLVGTGGSFVASASPSSSQIGISKGAGSHTVLIKSGSAAASTNASITIVNLTGQVTGLADWA